MPDSNSTTYHSHLVMQRAGILGSISEEPDRLTRRFATPAMLRANDLVAGWMQEAGMQARRDEIGNLIGRYEGLPTQQLKTQNSELKTTLVLGSHLDTVRDAGKYDGPLGVLVAIACVYRLHSENRRLPFAVEVAAFADEEGLRFGTSYLGSKAYAGSFDPDYLTLTDEDGVSMAEAIRTFGGDPSSIVAGGRSGDGLLGYCEVHIEQGPVLERMGLSVGVVSAIAGQTRFRLIFTGEAGHAGTVPMNLRRDALAAAAEFVLAAEALARNTPGLVATVGQLNVEPGAGNVIPGRATLSLDVRHQEDSAREEACRRLETAAKEICERRGLLLNWQLLQTNVSVPCSPDLSKKLEHAIEASGYPAHSLPSGAGHDGVIMSALCPIAMLFVRCRAGISHNPAESVMEGDVSVALEVMGRFIDSLAEEAQ